jgi:hypothetical protein
MTAFVVLSQTGFTPDMLAGYLQYVGFCNIMKVDQFDDFPDVSIYGYKGYVTSLNVIAQAC